MTLTVSPPAELQPLLQDGYVIVPNALPAKEAISAAGHAETIFTMSPYCKGAFYGERTKRFGGLLARHPVFRQFIEHPLMLSLAREILGPWCDTLQLNLTQAIALSPGALQQFPHRDQDMWQGPKGELEYLVNVLWPLSPFTEDNGATLIWPGSHGTKALEDFGEDGSVAALASPGDAIVFLGSTLHGAGANTSRGTRMGLVVSYCLGWLKPYENQWLVYPPSVARHFSRPLQELVGYVQHRPNLGNVEGQCPSVLLAYDAVGGPTDSLRPDQAEAVNSHADLQRLRSQPSGS